MSFDEKTVKCPDCGISSTFSAEEYRLFQPKAHTDEPDSSVEGHQSMEEKQERKWWQLF